MDGDHKQVSPGGSMVLLVVLVNAIILKQGFVSDAGWYALLNITLPLLMGCIAWYEWDVRFRRH